MKDKYIYAFIFISRDSIQRLFPTTINRLKPLRVPVMFAVIAVIVITSVMHTWLYDKIVNNYEDPF